MKYLIGLFAVIVSGLTHAASPLHLVGELVPDKQVAVPAQEVGQIQQYQIELGDKITKGQVVVRIDVTDYQHQLSVSLSKKELASIELEHKTQQLKRIKNLQKNNNVSLSELDQVSVNYQLAKANFMLADMEVRQAHINLEQTETKAPFSGYVVEAQAEVGGWVKPGDPLFILASLNPIKARFILLERDYLKLTPGQTLSLSVDALPDVTLVATVKHIGISQQSGYPVELEIDNADLRLRPGFTVRAVLEGQE